MNENIAVERPTAETPKKRAILKKKIKKNKSNPSIVSCHYWQANKTVSFSKHLLLAFI